MEVWTFVALLYFVITYPLSLCARILERRLRLGEA
jgi:ABC-type amino acid transport system permease subunit